MSKKTFEEYRDFFLTNGCDLEKTAKYADVHPTTITRNIIKSLKQYETEFLNLGIGRIEKIGDVKESSGKIYEFLEARKSYALRLSKENRKMKHSQELSQYDEVQKRIDKEIKPSQTIINNYYFRIDELKKPFSEEKYIPPEVKKEIENLENKREQEQKKVDAKVNLKARQAPKPMFILGVCIFLEILLFFWALSQGIAGIIAFFTTLIILFIFTASKPMKHRFWFLVERFFTQIAEIFYNWINGISATIDEIEKNEKNKRK